MERVLVIYPDIGHYHHARITAASDLNPAVEALELYNSSEFPQFKSNSDGKESPKYHRLLWPGRGFDARRRRELLAMLDRTSPNVVFVPGWAERWAHVILSWSLTNRRPAVVMSDSTEQDFNRTWWRELVKRKVVSCFTAGFVGGQRHVEYMESLGMPPDRIFTGYDVVDNAHFEHGAIKARKESAQLRMILRLPEKYFLASARFVEKKNLYRLVEAFSVYRMMTGRSGWSLVLLGDGELRSRIEGLVEQLDLTSAVMMPGFKQYAELPAYYGLAGAFVHASTSEQWGLVVNEAMASGLPVIVSNRCGCVPELVKNGDNGFVFDPLDVGGLAKCLCRMAALAEKERSAWGARSCDIVSSLGPESFAVGLSRAAETALRMPRASPGSIGRAIVNVLKWR